MKRRHLILSFCVTLIIAFGGIAVAQQTAAPKKRKAPQEWEPDIAKFEAADRETPAPKGGILFLGSSSIRLWNLKESFPGRVTLNRGFGGSTLADTIYHFDRLVLPYEPKAMVIYAGDNDVSAGLTADEVFADFKKLAALIQEKTPGVPAIYVAIKPSMKRWSMWPTQKAANDLIASWCAEHEGFDFADIAKPMLADAEPGQAPKASWFAKDGLHLSPEGYAGWTAVINPLLDKALKAH
ncbi:MAG: hypothetical protein KDM64_05515 [Verrucomicrobiae bacterium]|nr:hypothetical protein [Verrucomicrobiae bacterium]